MIENIREKILAIENCETDVLCPTEYKGNDPCAECRTNQIQDLLTPKGDDEGLLQYEEAIKVDFLSWELWQRIHPFLKAQQALTMSRLPDKEDIVNALMDASSVRMNINLKGLSVEQCYVIADQILALFKKGEKC